MVKEINILAFSLPLIVTIRQNVFERYDHLESDIDAPACIEEQDIYDRLTEIKREL
jgi:hypothetical protein